MAYIFSDSFDFYTTSGDLSTQYQYGGWTYANTYSIASTFTRFNVGKSLDIWADVIRKTDLANSSSTVFLNFSIYSSVTNGSGDEFAHFTFFDGATSQVSIVLYRTGNMVFKLGGVSGTTVATYTAAASSSNVWYNFQIKIKIDPSAGTIDVRKNGSGSSDFSATGLTTRNSSNSYVNGVEYGTYAGHNQVYLDDLYLFDDNAGSAPSDWTGDIRSYSLTATADTAQKDFTPQGSANNYANVGKFAPNTATYNYSSTVGNEDLFDITNLSVTPSSIVGVTTKTIMSKSDSSPRNGQPIIKSGSTADTGTDEALSSSYVGYINNWPEDPNTAAAWTASGVNALQVGYKVSA